MQKKLTETQLLPDEQGRIIEAGWATGPVFDYQSRNIRNERMKIREWDSYILISSGGDYALTMHLADNRAMGQASACFYDIKNKTKYDLYNPKPLHGSSITLPKSTVSGSSVYKDLFCAFMYLVNSSDRHLYCKYSGVFNASLEANLHLTFDPLFQSVSVLIPMNDDKTQFCGNQVIPCMPVNGSVTVNSQKFEFNSDTDFAVLDWGRGVWTKNSRRIHCVGNAVVDGKPFGFNIGYGFGNADAATENAFFYNGVCYKLDKVFIDYPSVDDNYKTCTVRSNDKRFEMQIEPIYYCENKRDFFVVHQNEKIMFGRMSGIAVTDDGTKLDVKDMICYFEQSTGKY